MAALLASATYTFRRTVLAAASGEDHTILQRIDKLIVDANNAYHARRYRDAISLYQQAEALVVAHLLPSGSRNPWASEILVRSAELVDTLIDVSAETLNGHQVAAPQSIPRPRAAISNDVVKQLDKNVRLSGLDATVLDSTESRAAAADWRLSRDYAAQGNTKAAEAFRASALKHDERTVSLLDKAFPANRGLVAASISDVLPFSLTAERSFTGQIAGVAVEMSWNAAENAKAVLQQSYKDRASSVSLDMVAKHTISDIAAELAHLFGYTIPLGLAEAYRAIGDFATAEGYYLQVAGYQYLNQPTEAPYVWQGLAGLYLDWGNALFRAGEVADAQARFVHVVNPDDTEPGGALYSAPPLAAATQQARTVLTGLSRYLADPTQACIDDGVHADIAEVILDVRAQLTKIVAGLDFFGHPAVSVPIWTFDYLQSVANQLAQQAVMVERDVINFWDQADRAQLTYVQLSQAVAQGDAEVDVMKAQLNVANQQLNVYQKGQTLAETRASNADANADDYADMSAAAIMHQALSAQLSGGDNGDAAQLNRLADRMNSGPYKISGSRGTLAAAESLAASKRSRAYEIATMGRTAHELHLAADQAAAEVGAAQAQVAAQGAALAAAQLRSAGARELLQTYQDATFTADVWKAMGDRMYALYRRYLTMALDVARLTQRAYNFENDTSVHLIKLDYTGDEVRGLLAADALLADIQSFTYDQLTSGRGKAQPVSHTISLAELRGYEFETSFRRTGVLDFETKVEDFDEVYPGSFGGRIQAVEVEVLGIVPPRGLSGTLTNTGVSSYRLPSDLWADGESGLRFRVQSRETQVLSDFDRRQDSQLFRVDPRLTGTFEGAGVASSWRLELPKAVNDLDYGAITDVRVTFHYLARFDVELQSRVLTRLETLPGIHERQRGIPLRWLYPEAFFALKQTGEAALSLRQRDFPTSQTKPVIESVDVLVVTEGVSAANLGVQLSTPGNAAAVTVTNANGIASSETLASPWAGLTGGTALGEFTLGLDADLSGLVNLALILNYSFTPKA